MKRRLLLLSLFLLLLSLFFASCSKQEMTEKESGELEFALTSNEQNYKVVGIGTHRGTTVTIPETYNGKSVVFITEGAFQGNEDIKKVIIPKTITQIYARAFDGCTSLEKVECTSTTINMIAQDAFRDTEWVKNLENYENGGLYMSNTLIAVSPKATGAFRIKDGTFTIAYQAFQNAMISSVTVPSGCSHLGKFTFYEAKKLESVIFEDAVGYLGEGLFYNCPSLKTVDISKGCANINERAFFGCSSLRDLRLSSNLTNIRDGVFSNCTSLESLALPDSCQTIGNEAFLGCTSLQSVSGASSLKSVGTKAFRDCEKLTVCSLPLGASYGILAFANTPLESYYRQLMSEEESGELAFALTSNGQNYKVVGIGTHCGTTVTIPESYQGKPVIFISQDAFKGNQNIKKVIIPKTVTQIYARAFDGCTYLATVECRSKSINMIAEDAFRGTAWIKNLEKYENGGLYMSNTLVAVSPKATGSFRVKDGTFTIAYQAFKNAEISSLTVPKGCYHLGKFTFYEAKKLESVVFEDAVGYLGEGLFSKCSALKTVDISKGCANINERVFSNCTALQEIRLPTNLVSVKDGAFSGCTSLKSMVLPDSCQTIGNEAFLGCTSLQSVSGASSLKTVGTKAFFDCQKLTSCKIPQSAVYGELAFANTPLE